MKQSLKTIDQTRIPVLSELAEEVFKKHFTPIIGKEQAEYMIDLFLSPDAIAKRMKEGSIFTLVEVDETPAAFAEWKKEDARLFLSKLYVKEEYRNLKLAKTLLGEANTYAKKEAKTSIYLTVNKHNDTTIAIYKHWGFQIIDAIQKDIGHGYIMDDYIMEKEV